jgi:Uncharacterised protein family (UPF0137)
MGKVNELLTERLKKTDPSSKMAALAQQSANGNLTSFSGIFTIAELSEKEKSAIESILKEYALNDPDISNDLKSLIFLTSEVKAINNQAALLHGERIKKAHAILTRYRDGAFTAWLIAAYGNRQTPYNLMQYYEFCTAMPKNLRFQIELMPRQAIYTLASRQGSIEKKQQFVEKYQGENKEELLLRIREMFPLEEKDQRRRKNGESVLTALKRLLNELKHGSNTFTKTQKESALTLVNEIQFFLGGSK